MRVLFSQKTNFKPVRVTDVKPGDTFEKGDGVNNVHMKLAGHEHRAAVNLVTAELVWFDQSHQVYLLYGHFAHEGRRDPETM